MKTLVAAVAFLVACHAALAQQAEVKDKGTRLDYRTLVQGLISPNRPIKCDNSKMTISIPPNYDWKAQERIERNRKILFEHCAEALPFLIEGCTDARYSLISKWSEDEDYYSWSVGRVCSEIIARHVEVFRHHIRFTLPMWHQYNFIPLPRGNMTKRDKKEIQQWWRGARACLFVNFNSQGLIGLLRNGRKNLQDHWMPKARRKDRMNSRVLSPREIS